MGSTIYGTDEGKYENKFLDPGERFSYIIVKDDPFMMKNGKNSCEGLQITWSSRILQKNSIQK